ncbi:MAG: ABC-F family ATP-binding cassette domain-containing protein [Alphaproteobacteria bacterium]|nr:ABC-F family ATP-binding cassette domain-containing protein [Alphaproteobacteria bacterium]
MTLPVFTIHNGLLRFTAQPLFQNLDLNILENEHVCLIGRNGQGKSTLLKVLAGIHTLDDGTYYQKPGIKIHYLPQDIAPPSNLSIREIVMQTAQHDYAADIFLDALKINPMWEVDALSGGQKRRILLARALAGNPDVLLLDEPTNHLDLEAIHWLEDYLNRFMGAVIMISHDRYFLRRTTRSMLWLDRGQLRKTERSYAYFEDWKEEISQNEKTSLNKLESKLRLEEHWKQRGVTARRKRNQGRLERLHEMRQRRRTLLAGAPKKMDLSPTEKAYGSQLVAELFDVEKTFGDHFSIGPFSSRIFKNDRIAIVGQNGVGKTTLLKMIIGQIKPDKGRVRLGKTVDIAYFEQERHTMVDHETPWQYLCPTGGDTVEVQGRHMHVVGYLKKFMFDDKQARGQISILSGGEKNRLQLAKVLSEKSNVLILDEPTNDLDADTLDLLIELLSQYDGTLILISHDRDFIDQLVTAVIGINTDGRIQECVGGYSDYEAMIAPKKLAPQKSKNENGQAVQQTQADKTPIKPKRLSYNEQRDYDTIPKKLELLAQEITDIETALHDASLYLNDPQKFDLLTAKLEELKAQQDALEYRWLEIDEQLNTL